MNIFIVGNGAREHAFAWAISKSNHDVSIFTSSSNAGLSSISANLNVDLSDFNVLKKTLLDNSIDMVLVGPEIPLIDGITDLILNDEELKSVKVIGPNQKGAQLEGSKEFAKKFMNKYSIPTASYSSFDALNINEAIGFIKKNKPPYVLKADGPAAGKGVIIVDNEDEAIYYLKDMLVNLKFGKSSRKVIIEEFLSGIEMSCFVLFDGINYKILPYAKDYKQIGEGDTGLNTGGMGSVSPVNFLDQNLKNNIENKIIRPTVNGLIKENINYVGFIFIGLINVDGNPKVIEYNVRMGDPETQVVLPRIKNDFMDLMISCTNQNLDKIDLEFDSNYYTNVVIASGGYPEEYKKGFEITGLDNVKDSLIFHAGTAINNEHIVTNGGRVLSIVSSSKSMKEALKKSYLNVEKINFSEKTYRRDIGFDL